MKITLSEAFFGLSNLFHWPTPLLTEVMVCPMLFNIFCTSSTDGLTFKKKTEEKKNKGKYTSILGKLRNVSRTKMISPAVY